MHLISIKKTKHLDIIQNREEGYDVLYREGPGNADILKHSETWRYGWQVHVRTLDEAESFVSGFNMAMSQREEQS